MKDFLFNEESGQGMVEYGLILALVAIIAIVALKTVGEKVNGTFTKVGESLPETSAGH